MWLLTCSQLLFRSYVQTVGDLRTDTSDDKGSNEGTPPFTRHPAIQRQPGLTGNQVRHRPTPRKETLQLSKMFCSVLICTTRFWHPDFPRSSRDQTLAGYRKPIYSTSDNRQVSLRDVSEKQPSFGKYVVVFKSLLSSSEIFLVFLKGRSLGSPLWSRTSCKQTDYPLFLSLSIQELIFLSSFFFPLSLPTRIIVETQCLSLATFLFCFVFPLEGRVRGGPVPGG